MTMKISNEEHNSFKYTGVTDTRIIFRYWFKIICIICLVFSPTDGASCACLHRLTSACSPLVWFCVLVKFVFVLWIIAIVGKNKKWRGRTGPWQCKLFLSRLFPCQSRLLVKNWFVGRRSQHYFHIFHGYCNGAAWFVGRRSQHYFHIFHGY